MSSDAESISSGMTLPGWMRAKVEKNDFDGIPFSPPSHDESFFYIRYPVKPSSASSSSTLTSSSSFDSGTKSGIRQITDIFHNERKNYTENQLRHVDFSNHTEPCKKFLNKDSTGDTIKNPPKSFGIDDGFKGSGAACGNSIVKVAQQMVSNRTLTTRGFKVANLEDSSPTTDPENSFQTKTIEDQQIQTSKLIQPQSQLIADDIIGVGDHKQLQQRSSSSFLNQQQQQQHNQQLQQQQQQMTESNRLMYRRGSRSLPSSPLGSPKSMRKYNPNPYFTTTSLFSSNNYSSSEGRGWFLSSLLGIQRDATSTSSIAHIEEEPDLSSQNKFTNNNQQKSDNQKVLRAKPSELREMNFWSPTSM